MEKFLYPFKKAKDLFVYDIKSNKYYDLQSNSNILGHSNKKITTIIKNNISSSWFIKNNTIYHQRLIKLINKIFKDQYSLFFSYSLVEFFCRFNNYSNLNNYKTKLYYENFIKWTESNFIKFNNSEKSDINIYDIAGIYLESKGNEINFKSALDNLKSASLLNIYNYFWYPEINIPDNNADIIILPEIYSGNFDYVLILINRNSILLKDYKYFCYEISETPSLYISSSLKYYYEINKIKPDLINLPYKEFTQSRRIFTYNEIDKRNKIADIFYKNNILLNTNPPYYNYLPAKLEDYQKNYLKRIKI